MRPRCRTLIGPVAQLNRVSDSGSEGSGFEPQRGHRSLRSEAKKGSSRPAGSQMKSVLEFLTDLAQNNNREWFAANKERYTDALAVFTQFSERFIAGIQQFDDSMPGITPKDCMWRIYRDTRFSKDKTPYKDHFGVYPCAGQPGKPQTLGKHSDRAGYYFHVQPGQCMFAAGMWCPNPDLLNAVRRHNRSNATSATLIRRICSNVCLQATMPTSRIRTGSGRSGSLSPHRLPTARYANLPSLTACWILREQPNR